MLIDVIPHANYPVRAGAIAVFFILTLLKVGDVFSYLLAKTLQIFVAGCTIRPPYFLLPRFPFPRFLPHTLLTHPPLLRFLPLRCPPLRFQRIAFCKHT